MFWSKDEDDDVVDALHSDWIQPVISLVRDQGSEDMRSK